MSMFRGATYCASAHHLRDLPPAMGPEIAFAGRSNAGKSSAINTLAQESRLAFVSKTPGRTQQINFFRLPGGQYLVDLPGYGYAKVAKEMRAHWEEALAAYLLGRSALFGLVLIMDARHPLTALDRQMLRWFSDTGKPVHVLLTKADKLSRQQGIATLRAVERDLGAYASNYTVQLFSSLKRTGIEEVEAVLRLWLGEEEKPQKKPRSKGNETGGVSTP